MNKTCYELHQAYLRPPQNDHSIHRSNADVLSHFQLSHRIDSDPCFAVTLLGSELPRRGACKEDDYGEKIKDQTQLKTIKTKGHDVN